MDEQHTKANKEATLPVPCSEQGQMLIRRRRDLTTGMPLLDDAMGDVFDAPETYNAVITVTGLLEQYPVLVKHQNYDPKSAKFRLVTVLNELFVGGRIPRAARNVDRIDQKYLGRVLGVHGGSIRVQDAILVDYESLLPFVEPLEGVRHISSKPAIPGDGSLPDDPAGRQITEVYPSLYKFQFYQPKSSARQLVDYLNARILSGTLVRGQNGRIHRREIAKSLRFTASALNFYLKIIRAYEDAVGLGEGDVNCKLPAMRAWLDQNLAQGTLDIRDDKIVRKQLLDHFGVSAITNLLTRYPKLSDLISEYDEKVADWKYVPLAIASELEVLKGLLVNPPIDKDGLTISRKALAETMGLPTDRLRRRPHSDYVKAAEEAWRVGVAQSRHVAICFDKPFRFESLIIDGWPAKFIERAAQSFGRKARAGKLATAENHYLMIIDLLRFVAANGSPSCIAVVKGMTDGVSLSTLAAPWKLATLEFRDSLGARYPNRVSANSKVASCNAVMRLFGNEGVLPLLDRPLQRFREDSRSHLRSVAEAQVKTEEGARAPTVDDYLRFAMSMLKEAGTKSEMSFSTTEEGDFTRTLRQELERESPSAVENPATVILRVLDRRLKLIGDAVWQAFEDGRRIWERGQELLARAVITDEEWSIVVNHKTGGQTARNRLLARLFPKTDIETGIANLLSVVSKHYACVYPSSRLEGRSEGQLFAKFAFQYGGSPLLQSHLSPSTACVSAALTLYMLASGSNVSVGRELYHDCVEHSEEPHHSKITGYKSRAGGKPIFVTLEDRSHAVTAMKWLQKATALFRGGLASDVQPFLFINHSMRGGLKLLPEQTHRREFQALVASIPELEGLNLSPNMLRPSILLKAALEGNGSTRMSVAMGQHGTGVNQGYVNKAPYRFLHDLKIRHFTNHMETLVIQRVEQVQALLGVSPEKFEERMDRVAKTGLGTLCADRNGRPGSDGQLCKSITCWNDCPQLIVIARASDMAILQVWQHSLRAVEGDWIRDRPERWAEVWLPWLEFVNVIEEKMRQSFANVWRDATKIAEKIMAAPGFAFMRPF